MHELNYKKVNRQLKDNGITNNVLRNRLANIFSSQLEYKDDKNIIIIHRKQLQQTKMCMRV